MARHGMLLLLAVLLVLPSLCTAQTTAGIGTTVVIPVTAQTGSFASEVTVFNPGPSLFTASVKFYEANNASAPGLKTCNDITVSANRSVQFHLATQCALGTSGGSQFGLLVLASCNTPAKALCAPAKAGSVTYVHGMLPISQKGQMAYRDVSLSYVLG